VSTSGDVAVGNTGSSGVSLTITSDTGGLGGPTLTFQRISGGSTTRHIFMSATEFVFDFPLNVPGCTGCSTLAEMMEVSGVEEGDSICVDSSSGNLEKCEVDSSLSVVGVATEHAEQILNLGCGSAEKNTIRIGGNAGDWRLSDCDGWFPVALEGVHEFTKVDCLRSDGSALVPGDRLVTTASGRLRPLLSSEQGGDAIAGIARTRCNSGKTTDLIHVQVR